jgi:MerR family mercuric resistance operon transcriptional regulator
MSGSLRIGEVAKRAGVSVDTLRYYERRALLGEPRRLPSGYRLFGSDSVRRVRFIRRAQELGFSLAEIAELLALRVGPGTHCQDVQRAARRRLDEIELRLARLAAMRRVLHELLRACARRSRTEECPILAALDAEEGVERERARRLRAERRA